MKRLLSILCLLCLVLAATARPQPGDADWFPICAWGFNKGNLPGPLTQEVFDTMAECGFTIAGFANTREELDLIHNAGMVAWVLDDDFHSTFWKGYDGDEVFVYYTGYTKGGNPIFARHNADGSEYNTVLCPRCGYEHSMAVSCPNCGAGYT